MPAICFPLPSQTYFMTQLNQDYCPRCLKDIRVPGCALSHPGNYCPIAVLSPFAKILERLVYNQLNHFLEKDLPLVAETNNSENSKIYVNESLTNYLKRLFGRIKEYKRANNVKYL